MMRSERNEKVNTAVKDAFGIVLDVLVFLTLAAVIRMMGGWVANNDASAELTSYLERFLEAFYLGGFLMIGVRGLARIWRR